MARDLCETHVVSLHSPFTSLALFSPLSSLSRVHVHCFTGSLDMAQQLLESFPNLCLGFTGVVTFKNAAEVLRVVEAVPLHRILLETDGPYMAPVPHRGSPAHPGHVPHVAAKIAQVKAVTTAEVFSAARANTRRVYGF